MGRKRQLVTSCPLVRTFSTMNTDFFTTTGRRFLQLATSPRRLFIVDSLLSTVCFPTPKNRYRYCKVSIQIWSYIVIHGNMYRSNASSTQIKSSGPGALAIVLAAGSALSTASSNRIKSPLSLMLVSSKGVL